MKRVAGALILLGLALSPALAQEEEVLDGRDPLRTHAVDAAPGASTPAPAAAEPAASPAFAAPAAAAHCARGAGWRATLEYYACVVWAHGLSTPERAIAALVALLTLSTFLLWLTTRRTANAAREAAKHIPAVERAYIFIQPREKGGFTGSDNTTVARVEVQNFGPTPGFLETLYGEFSPDPPKGKSPKYNPSKGTKYLIDIPIAMFDTPTPLDQRFETPGVGPVYFFGYVEYRDIFKQTRTSRFCTLIDPVEGTATLAGERAWNDWD